MDKMYEALQHNCLEKKTYSRFERRTWADSLCESVRAYNYSAIKISSFFSFENSRGRLWSQWFSCSVMKPITCLSSLIAFLLQARCLMPTCCCYISIHFTLAQSWKVLRIVTSVVCFKESNRIRRDASSRFCLCYIATGEFICTNSKGV